MLPTLIQLQITASKLFYDLTTITWKPTHKKPPLSSKTPKKACFGGALVESSSTEKLLVIQIDSALAFDDHISSICNKVGKK